MVAEVQSKMYLSGYYSMKDLSNSTGFGGWSLPHENNSLKNGQHYGMYLSAPITDGVDYDSYEKEKLRQTIMKQESIFRQQVHELHRLYRKQRDLMNEIRSQEQSSRFTSGLHYEDDKRSWCASSFPAVGSSYGKPLSSSAEVIPSPQSSIKLTPNASRLRVYEPLDLKCKKPQRRLFDLEVPADRYIDDEADVEGEFTKSNELNQAGDKKLANLTRIDGNNLRSDSYPRRNNLADLNEPIEVDELSALASDQTLGNGIFSQEQRQSHASSAHVYANMWSTAKQLSENRLVGKNEGIGNLHRKNKSNEIECLPHSIQAGQTTTKIFQAEDFKKPVDLSRIDSSQAKEFVGCLPCDQNTAVKVLVKRKIFGVEVAEGNYDASSFASKVINVADSEPASTLSWTKPESSLNLNSIKYGAQGPTWGGVECTNSVKSLSEVACKENCVSLAESLKVGTQQTLLPWLRASTQVYEKSLKVESNASQRGKVMQSPIQDSSSTTRVQEAENRRVEKSDCSSVKMILGFPIFSLTSKPDSVASLSAPINSPLSTELVRSDLASSYVYMKSVEQLKCEDPRKGLAEDSSHVRHQIDLNECVVEEDSQCAPPSPIAKPTTGIDLEAPFVAETYSDEEFLLYKLNKPCNPSRFVESGLQHKCLDTIAAEALVAIASCHYRDLLDNTEAHPQEDDTKVSQFDSLYLLADIISLEKDNSDKDCTHDDIDEFEHIVLNLPETAQEECGYVPPASDGPKEAEKPVALLPRRPRRGQARRGRQRIKDFQSEVLPSMAALSRNEVTEDLQTIEGLVRAIGGTWQSSLTLRNSGRGGGGRGRRRSGGSSAAATALPVVEQTAGFCAVQAQQGNESIEPGLEETSLTGWGKRTRRPPRQRCPISNSLLPLK